MQKDFPLLRSGLAAQNIPKLLASPFYFCTGGEARTPDTWFWRPVLYQLSYARLFYLFYEPKTAWPKYKIILKT